MVNQECCLKGAILDKGAALLEDRKFAAARTYERRFVSNLNGGEARLYFNLGLRRLLGYHHQEAVKYFEICFTRSPDCALVPALMALCHCPNYNFTGEAYYSSTSISTHYAEDNCVDEYTLPEDFNPGIEMFPCQETAHYFSRKALEIVDRLNCNSIPSSRKSSKKKRKNKVRNSVSVNGEIYNAPSVISESECLIIAAIKEIAKYPGVKPENSEEVVGRPYADAFRKAYQRFGNDPDIAYFFAEALMVLNAWNLYDFPSTKTLSPDVDEARAVLEASLREFPEHAGLCHLYIHLCEMSPDPARALAACEPLRSKWPNLGHLIHMPTHIDALVGDYEACVRYNKEAIDSDMNQFHTNPDSAGVHSFYFGYIVHNFHMLAYGCILGGMEQIGMETANQLNEILDENLFANNVDLTPYIESYSALEVHLMVRFGRWEEILKLPLPQDKLLMLYRACSIHFARALAYAALGDVENAKSEADIYDKLSSHPSARERLLHNNIISRIFEVDAVMIRGEIAYREGKYNQAFELLRQAVSLQDALKYDEPWGKMQPIRHALGGLLLEQNQLEEAEVVFRVDLKKNPKNPWGLVGLINCLKKKKNEIKRNKSSSFCQHSCQSELQDSPSCTVLVLLEEEVNDLTEQLIKQRKSMWADFEISVSCECCRADKEWNSIAITA